jgi:hypothetical protein
MNRADRQRAESPRFMLTNPRMGKRARAHRAEMRQVRLHRYQWALRRGFNEARLERMKPRAVGL